MFYSFGGKAYLAKFYPEPQHDTIIEPFAGSAAYSLHDDYWKRNVILVEKNPDIVAMWNWFINDATPDSVATIPPLVTGDPYPEGDDPVHILIRSARLDSGIPKRGTVTAHHTNEFEKVRRRVLKNLHKVAHWTIIEGDYTQAPDIEATWFIDPPYAGVSGGYNGFGAERIDFPKLGEWCLSRRGQIIVCEDDRHGGWLPFEPLGGYRNNRNRKTEMVYTT